MTKHRIILLIIILLAFFLRVWQLPQTPPGLWYDEAYNAMDALWMVDTGQHAPFLLGNNGRETMWHYLVWLSIWMLGSTTLAVRGVGSLIGVITVPIMYTFTLAFSKFLVSSDRAKHHHKWFALAAAGWLAVSWWHLLNSRAGFRPILLPPILMLALYFFWRGWWRNQRYLVSGRLRFNNFILAGLFLGLAQYTYLPARLAPLIFGGLTILWTLQIYRNKNQPQILVTDRSRKSDELLAPKIKKNHPSSFILHPLLGVLITAAIAALTFAPLGLFFLETPDALSSRTGDVIFIPDNLTAGAVHLFHGITLFLGAGHKLYRHHLPGRAMLGWLEIPFFWLGLVMLLRPSRLRRPETHLILLSLGVMWLPALLASPPVHSLRPIGLTPFYYLIVTTGLYHASRLTYHVLPTRFTSHTLHYTFPLTIAIILTLTGFINSYDYFWRWAKHPEVYKEYNTPLVDLTNHLINLTQTHDLIIPFHLYTHPTVRYLLQDTFTEVEGIPSIAPDRPVEMLLLPDVFQLLYVGNIPQSPALVWLTQDKHGQGKIYVSRPPRTTEQVALNELLASTQLTPFQDKLGRDIAYIAPITNNLKQSGLLITNLFDISPLRTLTLNWANLVELKGYDVTPHLAQPGQPVTLNLYWHSLTDATFDYRLFLQIIDSSGNPINQSEEPAFSEDMYRWRWDGILPTQHTLWLGPNTPSGPYLIRLGFFDPLTNQRLPLKTDQPSIEESPHVDQVQLGLFYVSPNGNNPHLPTTPLSANFADFIQLTGITLPNVQQSKIQNPKSKIAVIFHWKTLRPTNKPYTVFLQLLNENGEAISGWDSQPFNGLYPTNRWSPGENITNTFVLPLPEARLPSGTYRLISGFYDFDTGQRLPVIDGGEFVELGEVIVE